MENLTFHEPYIARCLEMAISAGKKGYDTFGALFVSGGEVLEYAENCADYARGIFGHAEFNVVHKLANKYPDAVLTAGTLYTSTAPCTRCLLAIASLGIRRIVYSVSYEALQAVLPDKDPIPDYVCILKQLGVDMEYVGPVLPEAGLKVFQYWGGQFHTLEEIQMQTAAGRRFLKAIYG